MHLDLFFIGVVTVAALAGALWGMAWQQRRPRRREVWPRQWNLSPRPLFTTDERLLFKELRAALPDHAVLAKLNLLRFCQAADRSGAKPWYERLQTLHVSFAVCTPGGNVVSVIDIESPGRASSAQSQRLKEAALEACRIRYVRCIPGQWPHPALLGAWALGHSQGGRTAPFAGKPLHEAGDEVARRLRQRRAERAARWAESSFAQDSFFAFDTRLDDELPPVAAPRNASGRA